MANGTVRLARSYQTPDDCGHEIPWDDFCALDQRAVAATKAGIVSFERTCPLCQAPIHFAYEPSRGESVYFKYGKMVYRLSVPNVDHGPLTERHQPHNSSQSSIMWSWLGWANTKTPFQSVSSSSTIITAQQRIQSVLGITHGLKILYKGKVLYPPPLTLLPGSTERCDWERDLSNRLMELSVVPSTTEPAKTSVGPPFLLVMGTPDIQHETLRRDETNRPRSAVPVSTIHRLWITATTLTVADVGRWLVTGAWSSVGWCRRLPTLVGSGFRYCWNQFRIPNRREGSTSLGPHMD